MKLATSNIALSPFAPARELAALPGLGFAGLEVAISRVWDGPLDRVTPAMAGEYRRLVESAGLVVVGLHSLFWQVPELGLFKDAGARAATLDFLERLSEICRDLGGRTLIWGGGRRRGPVTEADAVSEAVEFMGALCVRVEGHGTCFCFEPLGPEDSDFINKAAEALAIVAAVGHPALAMQLDAKALAANGEAAMAPFRAAAPHLVHFHANEPDLGVLGTSGRVDHAAFGAHLRDIGYAGYVSNEQRLINAADPLSDIARSAEVLKVCYLGETAGPPLNDGPPRPKS